MQHLFPNTLSVNFFSLKAFNAMMMYWVWDKKRLISVYENIKQITEYLQFGHKTVTIKYTVSYTPYSYL